MNAVRCVDREAVGEPRPAEKLAVQNRHAAARNSICEHGWHLPLVGRRRWFGGVSGARGRGPRGPLESVGVGPIPRAIYIYTVVCSSGVGTTGATASSGRPVSRGVYR